MKELKDYLKGGRSSPRAYIEATQNFSKSPEHFPECDVIMGRVVVGGMGYRRSSNQGSGHMNFVWEEA